MNVSTPVEAVLNLADKALTACEAERRNARAAIVRARLHREHHRALLALAGQIDAMDLTSSGA